MRRGIRAHAFRVRTVWRLLFAAVPSPIPVHATARRDRLGGKPKRFRSVSVLP